MMADEMAIASLTARQASIEARLAEHADALAAVKTANHTGVRQSLSTITTLRELGDEQKQLDNAAYYLRHLQIVAGAVQRAKGKDSLEALYDAYVDLAEVTATLTKDVGTRDRAIVNVITRAERAKTDIFTRMESVASGKLRQVLADLDWPNEGFNTKDHAPFIDALRDSLAVSTAVESLPKVLAPFAVLAEAVSVRFNYHFNANRPTNRLDKPEWFLRHLLTVISDRQSFLHAEIQPILDAALPATPLEATDEFIRAVLPLAQAKLQATSGRLLNDVKLLSHAIAEAQSFDDVLRGEHGFTERDGSKWSGTTQSMLADDVYRTWLASEADLATERFQIICDTIGAWELDPELDPPPSAIYDIDDAAAGGGAVSDVLLNKAAVEVVQLFEALTTRFERVVSTLQGRKFVDTVQKPILERYLARVSESTDAFAQLSHGFSGGFPTTDIAGLAGLQRLTRQYSAVCHLVDRMRGWNEDSFYNRCGGDSYLGTGAFDSLEHDYDTLLDRIWSLLGQHVSGELLTALKPYGRVQTWASDQMPQAGLATTTSTSVQLIKVFELARQLFEYMSTSLGGRRCRALYADVVAPAIESFVVASVIMRNRFSHRGQLQLTRDVWQLWATFAPFVKDPRRPMKRLALVVSVYGSGVSDDGESDEKIEDRSVLGKTPEERDFVGVLRGRVV